MKPLMIPIVVLGIALVLPFLAGGGDSARAGVKNATGEPLGTLTFTESKEGVRVEGRLTGLPPGIHGFHIHQVGQCTAPDFKSAGDHFNPGEKQHGDLNPQGGHAGDLANLTVGPEGSGSVNMLAKGATIQAGRHSLMQPGGTSVVIHASADDRKSDPSGNSGERIACGAIQK